MSRFIFILMILLLPLRGWMGESMATEMAAVNLTASKAVNTSTSIDLPVDKSMPNCDMFVEKSAESAKAKPACNYCYACHTAGIATTVEIHNFDKIFYAQPLIKAHSYTSANLAFGQKPPIL